MSPEGSNNDFLRLVQGDKSRDVARRSDEPIGECDTFGGGQPQALAV
jgi:hypothetical protein